MADTTSTPSSGSTVTSGGSTASSGSTTTSGATVTPTSESTGTTSGATVTSGGTTAGTTPAAPTSGTSGSGSQQSPGYITDTNNTIVLEYGQPFTYTISGKVDATTFMVGYIPKGVYLDTSKGTLFGTPTEVGDTLIIITTPGNPGVSVPLKVVSELQVGFINPGNVESTDYVSPTLRLPGSGPSTQLVGNGGTGQYTYAIAGNANGLTIDAKTGLMAGTLPTTEGAVQVTVTVSDGISTITVPLEFMISANIPQVIPVPQTDAQWWTAQATAIGTATGADQAALYEEVIYHFITNPTDAGVDLTLEAATAIVGTPTGYKGTTLILASVLTQVLNKSDDPLRKVLRTNPAIVIPNNWTLISNVADTHYQTNTTLQA